MSLIRPRHWLSCIVVTGTLFSPVVVAVSAQAVARTKSVWDGVYSEEQASRGDEQYKEYCAACHGRALEGQGMAPGLVGITFVNAWNGRSVDDLFIRIQATMPLDDPGRLTGPATRDIVAFLLKVNEFPAGNAELPARDDLKAVFILRQKP